VVSSGASRERTKSTWKSLTCSAENLSEQLATDFRAGTCFPHCLSPELAGGWDSQVERLQIRGRRISWGGNGRAGGQSFSVEWWFVPVASECCECMRLLQLHKRRDRKSPQHGKVEDVRRT
jgi:hypothetical protein